MIVHLGDRNADEIERIERKARAAAKSARPSSTMVVIDATPKASASRY